MTLTEQESLIADSITEAIGPKPIILCGSRATGEATDESDYDVFVVFPTLGIPSALPRLRDVSERLETRLQERVTINPLPRFRFSYPGSSLLVWKIRREGKVLAAPSGFELGAAEKPALSLEAASSYALSGIRYLTMDLVPRELASDPLSPKLVRPLRKAVLHLAQLQLLRQGAYAPRLDEALALIAASGDQLPVELAHSCDRPQTWFRTRDLLLDEMHDADKGAPSTLLVNAQYVALSALRRSGIHVRAIATRTAVRTNLEQAVVLLAKAILPAGELDRGTVSAAARLVPRWISPGANPTWLELRDAVERHWPQANPLLGL
jgi:predicted nucleotidyltransferase